MTGLAPDRYTETVRVLSVMASNVETAIASRTQPRVADRPPDR